MKKTIIYILIVMMVGSIFLSAIPLSSNSAKEAIVLRAVQRDVSNEQLQDATTILSGRLHSVGIHDFDIGVNATQSDIRITFKKHFEFPATNALLTTRGVLGFYETGNRELVQEMLQSEEELLRMLHSRSDQVFPAAVLGTCKGNQQSKVTELINEMDVQAFTYSGLSLAWGAELLPGDLRQLFILKGSPVMGQSEVDKAYVPEYHQGKGRAVLMELTASGAEAFSEMTVRNVSRSIAIVMDGMVYSAPVVQQAIKGGKCLITGSFSEAEAILLAAILDNGELPVDLILEE